MPKKTGINDPCPCGSGKKYQKCCGQAAEASPTPDRKLMDQQLSSLQELIEAHHFKSEDEVNDYLRQLSATGDIPESTPRTPLREAQDIIYDAWETRGAKKRVRMAMDALKISPDCADAYSLLAEEAAETAEQARDFYAQAVEAGERALGPEKLAEYVGHFWGEIETRPYMRARAGLARCLWQLNQDEAAIEHYRETLRLNPNDNQGIRYKLPSCLMERGDIDAAEKLLADYGNEATPDWLYTRALIAFLRQGDSAKARRWLKAGVKWNPHVVPYLLGQRRLPRSLPEMAAAGSEDEAANYVAESRAVWSKYRQAKKWVASQTAEAASAKPQAS